MFKSAVGFIGLKERDYSWPKILFKSVPCKFEASEGVGRMMEECSSLSICIEFDDILLVFYQLFEIYKFYLSGFIYCVGYFYEAF